MGKVCRWPACPSNSVSSDMKLGSFVVEQLSEGHFEISPGGTIVKAKSGDSDEYSALVGIDPVVVMHGDTATLLDAGIGLGLDAKGRSERLSNLHTNLECCF